MPTVRHDQDLSSLRAALDTLTALLLSEQPMPAVMHRVVELAHEGIAGCDLASVTYTQDGAPATIAATDPAAAEIDEAQYRPGSAGGPGLAAFHNRDIVWVTSMGDAEHWPEFRSAALAHGVHSSLSLPLAIGDLPVGALNLYGREDRAFHEVAPDGATAFAHQAVAALWSARTSDRTRELIGHLETALEHRDTIGMAKGIVMANEKFTPDEAFHALATASQHRNVKLHAIATEVVMTGATPA